MNLPSLLKVCIFAVAFAPCLSVRAQDLPIPPDVRAFAAEYVAAFNAKDPARVQALNLPEARACITSANKDVYDELMSSYMRDSIAANYRLTLLPVNEGNLKALAQEASFPVHPDRELHIDYEYPHTRDGGQVILWLVRRDGRWMMEFPCMTAQGLASYRDSAADRQQYVTLAAAIQEPLRSQLITMIRAYQLGEASERYKQATGCDTRTAMLVINALRDQVH